MIRLDQESRKIKNCFKVIAETVALKAFNKIFRVQLTSLFSLFYFILFNYVFICCKPQATQSTSQLIKFWHK